jgi:hypothetical protein
MKYLITILAITFFGMATPTEERVEVDFYGIWRTIDNEFVQINRNMDFETSFQRVSSKKRLMAKGTIQSATEGKIEISRRYPKSETYTSDYVFSPSGKTLVIMKPNSDEAWVLEKVR